MPISKIVWVGEMRREFAWIRDPDAHEYQVPCHGCPDYCELADGDEDDKMIAEVYDQKYCHGQTDVRKIVWWRVVIPYRREHSQYAEDGSALGCAPELEHAETQALAKLAALKLLDEEDEEDE